MRLLLLGATGLVGARALAVALADARVTRVLAPARRPLAPHDKLDAPLIDFARLDAAPDLWRVDAVACALGTTIKAAGSQEAFRAVDHDLPLAVAARAKAAGATAFALNSSLGADPDSRVFYSRVKGETERDLIAMGFASTLILRPGLLDGPRAEVRPGERAALVVSRLLAPILPRGWRPSPVEAVARALVEGALTRPPGVTIVSAADLV
jgi:uncharacterized protein YbjT (DUF2867 family)